MTRPAILVAGLGSELRGDDAVGAATVDSLPPEIREQAEVAVLGNPLDLIGRWDEADLVVVVDAVRSGQAPGKLTVLDLSSASQPSPPTLTSHTMGLLRVLDLARALGRAPRRVLLVGVEADGMAPGRGLSPAAGASVPLAARAVADLVAEAAACA